MTSVNCWKVLEANGYYRSFIEKNVRPDGRKWMEARPITLKVGSITTAEGSATVRFGNTSLVCGIKAEIAVPDLRRPNEGFIVPNVELYPCCSPSIKAGPPGDKAMVTSRLLAKVIENSGLIDLKSLCVVPSKVSWCLYCDVICLDYDGNLMDAALLALVSAFEHVTLPEVTWNPEDEKISVGLEKTVKLKLQAKPTSTTFTIYNSSVHLLDPTAEDESEGNGEITIVLKDTDSICMTQKFGGEFLPPETIQSFLEVARKRAVELTRVIDNAVKYKKKRN